MTSQDSKQNQLTDFRVDIPERFLLIVGYVYIMKNEYITDLIKIGYTTRTPHERATELQTTGVPTKFDVVHSVFVPNCELLEKYVHKELEKHRVSNDREFFSTKELSINDAIDVLNRQSHQMISRFNGWPNLNVVKQYIENELLKIQDAKEKRIQQIRLEKQVRAIEIQNEIEEDKNRKLNEIEEAKISGLKSIDSSTRNTINEAHFNFYNCFLLIVILMMVNSTNEKINTIFIWLPVVLLIINIRDTINDKKNAREIRKKYNLPIL